MVDKSMDKKQRKTSTAKSRANSATAFAFGDPEPVLQNQLTDYLGTFCMGSGPLAYYEPPVSLRGLARTFRANPHHGAIPGFIRNQVQKYYVETPLLSREELGRAVIDFEKFANCYFQRICNIFGEDIGLRHLPAVYMRKMKEPDRYGMLVGTRLVPFEPGEVLHLLEYDPEQSIYGLPHYLGGLQSVLLGEDATLFRRKYYRNGAHMGYVFFTNDPTLKGKDKEKMEEAIMQSKGAGNFRSMFVHIPGGTEKSVQIIPVGDITTKDEIERVKSISRNDTLAMWRIQPALAGVMPENTGGFGDIAKISRVYLENETIPRQQVYSSLNNVLNSRHKIEFLNPTDMENID